MWQTKMLLLEDHVAWSHVKETAVFYPANGLYVDNIFKKLNTVHHYPYFSFYFNRILVIFKNT